MARAAPARGGPRSEQKELEAGSWADGPVARVSLKIQGFDIRGESPGAEGSGRTVPPDEGINWRNVPNFLRVVIACKPQDRVRSLTLKVRHFKMVKMGIKILVLLTMLMAILHVEEVHGKKMSLEQIKGTIAGLQKSCIKDSGVEKSLVEKTQEGEFPPDPALQCYLKCLLKSMQVIKNDKLQEDNLLRQTDLMLESDVAPLIRAGVTACAQKATSSEVCELAWQFMKCWYENDPKLYIFP
ncbi:hypothetical protein KM043_018461 [Ampulex compressa]|nr:hypothetical protein KM043_018461 [Ampulex compressa]